MFPSKSFIVSGLTFRSLIHFEFIFVYGVRECSHFILFSSFLQFYYFILLFIFWLRQVFIVVCGLLTAVASLVAEHGLQACGLQQLWLAGSRAQAQQLWYTGLVAPRHVGSSRTRARTRVPCIGRRILNHCTTREVLISFFYMQLSSFPSTTC